MKIKKLFKPALGIIGSILVVSIIVSFILVSLSDSKSETSMNPTVGVFSQEKTADFREISDGLYYKKISNTGYDEGEGTDSYTDDRQIIKTGSLELVVEDVEESADTISDIAKKYGGIISHLDISGSQTNKKRASITFRVPNDSFELAIDEVKEGVSKVTRESVNTQDVTEQYADLQAQLKNKRAVEKQYLETLKKAWSIQDILNVQERLDRTRGDIERLEGRITYMENQVNMSTVNIYLVSESEAAVLGVVWNPLTKIKQAAYNTLESRSEERRVGKECRSRWSPYH